MSAPAPAASGPASCRSSQTRNRSAMPSAFGMPARPAGWGIPRFADRELTPQEEYLACARRDPVRIAAAGVEVHVRRGLTGGSREADQFILDLERAELFVVVQIDGIHRPPPSIAPAAFHRVHHSHAPAHRSGYSPLSPDRDWTSTAARSA